MKSISKTKLKTAIKTLLSFKKIIFDKIVYFYSVRLASTLNLKLLDKSLSRKVLFTLLVAIQCFVLSAQFTPEEFSKIHSGEKLKTILSGGPLPLLIDSVSDDKYSLMVLSTAWRSSFKHRKVYDRITISIKDTTKAMQKFDYLFTFKVDTFDALKRTGSFNVTMRFSYDPAAHKKYTDKVVYQFENSHKFKLTLISIKDSALVNPSAFSASSMQTNFNIESEILVERYYLGNYATGVTSISHSYPGLNKLRISWEPPASSGPNQYELEWAYIDTSGIDFDSLKYNFKNNSSKVLLSNTYYDLNTVFDAGILMYRVRRVRPDSVYFKYNKYSNWMPSSEPDMGYVADYNSANRLFLAAHESFEKNWDYQVAFAEEGLKKEVVNYFDGSLKRRQGVTLSNTNNFSLVDESIYDYHGREVIKIIPAPTDSNTIRFYKDFNVNQSGDPYSASDFDTSTTIADKCNGNYKAKPVGTQNGAGRYYSTSNPDKSNENAAIPDAGGYPLVQTQLMPDPTGRVASQSGIGVAHQLGSGHETKYTYNSAEQTELDELFGSEMGIAAHYKKNAVVDPNGQMSISYIDQHGRVVATSLTGGVPGMVDTLGNYQSSKFLMRSLIGNQRMINNSIVVNYNFNVDQAGTHKIFYKLESPAFVFGCLGIEKCLDCRYDLTVSLNDACGSNLLQFDRTIGGLFDTACGNFNFSLKDSISKILGSVTSNADSISFYLGTGEYNLVKTLRVNTDSLDLRIEQAIYEDTTCLKSIGEFIDDEIDKIDFSECSCDTCGKDTLTYCESRRQLMLEDLSPDGQYFQFDEDDYTVTDSTSILRNWGSDYIYWQIPASNYKDMDEKIDTLLINGIEIFPNELEVQDFVENFKPSWAEALLPYHPEYCYYKYCVDSLQASYIYDEVMMEIDDYDTALYYGYLNPIGNHDEYTQLYMDPFFVKNGNINAKGNAFKSKLSYLDDYTIGSSLDPLLLSYSNTDLWQFSRAIGFCEGISDSMIRQSCFKFYHKDNKVLNNWMNDEYGKDNFWNKFKAMYFQIKQKFIEERMNNEVCSSCCVKYVGPTCSNTHYRNKTSHFIRYRSDNDWQNSDSTRSFLLDSVQTFGVCEASVAEWDNALQLCENYNTHRDSILYHMLKVCKGGSLNVKSPIAFGTNDIPENISDGYRFTSFDEVLKHFIGTNYKNEICNIDLISSPRSYETDYENINASPASDCVCEQIKEEIKLYKGCYTKSDSIELGKEGLLVNEFVNALVDHNFLSFTDTTSRKMSWYPRLSAIATKLFVPVLGGSASTIKIKVDYNSTFSNVKTFHIYRNGMDNSCQFTFRLNPNTSNFTNIDTTKSDKLIRRSDGSFEFDFYKTTGGSVNAFVYNTCFNNLSKCSPNLAYSELEGFSNYFNQKYGTVISESELERLIAECGNGGVQSKITDKRNTYYLRYGSCPDYYKNYREPKDYYLMSFLNEMMRNNQYWRPTMVGYLSGNMAKRYLTTDERLFHCSVGKYDFLTQTKDYSLYKQAVGLPGDNYWWEIPRYVSSTISFVDGGSKLDTLLVNNYNSDPYFVGGFWIGSYCDFKKDSACFTSFGDPYKQLGVGTRPDLNEIDSLNYYRWNDDLGSFMVTAFNRSTGDSVWLTISNKCKAECNPLVRIPEFPVNYKDVMMIPGTGGMARVKELSVSAGLNSDLSFPFLDMLNGLGSVDSLLALKKVDIRRYKKSFKQNDYFDALIPASGAYGYIKELVNDSILIGKIGKESAGDTTFCQFGFKKSGTNRSWNYGDLEVFKNLRPDPEAIADAIKNDRMDMAGYQFLIKGGVVNFPGDTTWYDLRGWSSCWKFFEMTALNAETLPLFNLPAEFTSNCNCNSCVEMSQWSDSLYHEYPKLNPAHPNYSTIVVNYVNRKLNTNWSFNEIQSFWDECGLAVNKFMPIPMCDYRLSVKNTDCVGHADSMLDLVMLKTEIGFGYRKTVYSDSTEYCLDFSGNEASQIAMLKDSLSYYFASPYCNAFKKISNYRGDFDFIVNNIDSASVSNSNCNYSSFNTWFGNVKTNMFASSSNLSKTDLTNVSYSGDNYWSLNNNWLSKIRFEGLSFSQRQRFYDTLSTRWAQCSNIEIRKFFYLPELKENDFESKVCAIISGDTTCYFCDTIKSYIKNYQYTLSGGAQSYGLSMTAQNVEDYLNDVTDGGLSVYEGTSSCVSCSNSSLFVCNDPSDRVLAIVELMNKLAKLKKLNSSNYNLNSSFNTLLNRIKPEGTVLNAPAFQLQAGKLGGWNLTLKYNTYTSDVLSVSNDTNDFMKKFNFGLDTFIQIYPSLNSGTVNGFTVEGRDSLYNHFVYNFNMAGLAAFNCCEVPKAMLCPQPYTRTYDKIEPVCKEDEVLQAIQEGTLKYYNYLDSIRRSWRISYQSHCLQNAKETFGLGLFQRRYHTTLYYYDQGGNLVKTVPPQGVKDLQISSNRKDSIENYRVNIAQSNKFVNTQHLLSTVYQYNSLNQLVWQKTPDGGESRFWYDRLGRIVLSQNAVQLAKSGVSQKYYSYTVFDDLGRMKEVGEISNRVINADSLLNDLAYYNFWLSGSKSRTQIVKTYYDYPITLAINSKFAEGQRNLRGRVSSVCYFNAYASADTTAYTRATHYSYDIHGNVDHLIHDFPDMQQLGHRYKHLTYKYDLISGKVHTVAYQSGQSDQWFHRYQYDADNRLVLTETSDDSVIWDKDAEYKYYKHGPLARTLIGEHAVQGVDYVYTIHGWLKGVNSNTLKAGNDVGKDGYGSLRKYTARDAYGFTLGYYNDQSGTAYFDGDYKSIGTTAFEASKTGSPLGGSSGNLYNGNISQMVSVVNVLFANNSNSPLATSYRYDQLNRIKSVYTYNGIDIDSNKWDPGSLQNAYRENFTFDANGNIMTLKRYNKTTLMDNLTYNYKSRTNQLTYVDDAVSSGTAVGDIDDEASGNYRYDKIGNLTHDVAEQIDSIHWNVNGKIAKIVRTTNSPRPNLEFEYDAMGQRVLKTVKKSTLESTWDYTWYVRDAQGNVIATYSKKHHIEDNSDTSLYRRINNSIISQKGTDSLAAFIKQKFGGTQLNANLASALIARGYLNDFMNLYAGDTLLKYDSGFARDFYDNFCSLYSSGSDRTGLFNKLWALSKDTMMGMIHNGCIGVIELTMAILSNDNTSNQLLTALASLDMTRFNMIYMMSGGGGTPPLATKIGVIRGNPDPMVAGLITMQFNNTELESIVRGLSSTLKYNAFSAYDFCDLLNRIAEPCTYTNYWYDLVYDNMDEDTIKNIVASTAESNYLTDLLLSKDPWSINKLTDFESDLIADALKEDENLDAITYLMYLYKRFGKTVFNQVISDLGGDIKIRKTLTLEELHIYGSSRHGMYKPKRQVTTKAYEFDEINTSGGLATVGNATDSSIYKVNYHYFSRTLTQKQYELSNHLGNVLATILDRKTANTNSDTLTYYSADVSTAQYYYAYGSAISELSYAYSNGGDTMKYRYGFNGEELLNEMSGEGLVYDLGERFYDGRLGRMFSVDVLFDFYPSQSVYAYCYNRPSTTIDFLGMGGPYEPELFNDVYCNNQISSNNSDKSHWKLTGSGNLIIYLSTDAPLNVQKMEDASGSYDYIYANSFAEAQNIMKIYGSGKYDINKPSIQNLVIRTHLNYYSGKLNMKTLQTQGADGAVPLHNTNDLEVIALDFFSNLCTNSASIVITACSIIQRDDGNKTAKGATYAAKYLSNIFLKNTERKLYLAHTLVGARISFNKNGERLKEEEVAASEIFNFNSWLIENTVNGGFIEYTWDSKKNKRSRTKNFYNLSINSKTGTIDAKDLNIINPYDR